MNNKKKKDCIKSSFVGDKLNKTMLISFLNQSESKSIELIKYDKLTNEYEIRICGKISNMKYSKNFEEKVLEFMSNIKKDVKNINSRLDNIEQRLDVIEKRLDNIENCPTIKSELKNNK